MTFLSLSFDESLFLGRAERFLEIRLGKFIKASFGKESRNTVDEGIRSSQPLAEIRRESY